LFCFCFRMSGKKEIDFLPARFAYQKETIPWRFAAGLIAAPLIPLAAIVSRKVPRYRNHLISGILGICIIHGIGMMFYVDSDLANRHLHRGKYEENESKSV